MASELKTNRAFTLIELSIVLVIIGLIVGGVLVGRDLIKAAEIRAQITQIEKYNSAVNTFKGKFGFLPGDAPQSIVTQFGFTAAPTRPGTRSQGDGNGLVEGYNYRDSFLHLYTQSGENLWFWEDLSTNSGLIEGRFTTATNASLATCTSTNTKCDIYVPPAKLGGLGFITVYPNNNVNYFSLSKLTQIDDAGAANVLPNLEVRQAYGIDAKIDDGLPTNGRVLAQYAGYSVGWLAQAPNAATASSTTCFDTTSNQYSISQNNGNGVNCALSFQFQ